MLPPTQVQLAQLVGASRERVNKALSDFASRGWLRQERRSVVLTDLARLSQWARHQPAPELRAAVPVAGCASATGDLKPRSRRLHKSG